MHRRMISFALLALLLPLAAAAQSPPVEPAVPHPPGAHEAAPAPPHPRGAHEPGPSEMPSARHQAGAHEDKAAPAAPKAYIPGLEVFMTFIQGEHAKLWYAGRARNWPLAGYALGEIKEVMSDVQDQVPTFKDLPLADMLDAVITGEIARLEKAIEAKDPKAFAAGFDKLTGACNACHQATGNGFVRIQRPKRATFPNQDFSPHR
jgi:hypothetical protein